MPPRVVAADAAVRLLRNDEARGRPGDGVTAPFGVAAGEKVQAFHRSLRGYEPTPLVTLPGLAAELGVSQVSVKDESHRFGLKAFKALGASWAMSRALEGHAADVPVTFAAATDGNHGRAVAWSAAQLGHSAVVYLPSEASEVRVAAIAKLGARAESISGTFDDAVERVRSDAEANGWVLLQDTSWRGYEEVPAWVMQGYLTLIREALLDFGDRPPTHVLLQCGVGSFAASMTAYLVERLGAEKPVVVVVEPEGAACGMAAMESGDEIPPRLEHDPHTFMAGLACGQLSASAWKILRRHVNAWLTCSDDVARAGMLRLAHPVAGDQVVVSGESGAVTTGLLIAICTDPDYASIRQQLRLDADATVLLISTEGDTDEQIYRSVVR